ncbi:hypothetical protein Pyrde_0151 [Pyrodictium delaneyi]|uniref:Uncharacterized protein n=1 Tax=Pyrodictium delaneyi TaxID=1273541 RepID=A0A0N7JCS4_9CREN|nr:hypothetical protein [Pyrodictium delaneyi]ALL00201.1 hypothetical protein Pyrde_0151 [Pyrodictium delaneyi]OWJ54285.1 hypothetical protein Pdsh_07305 [Pyrodictium delaneyi]
MHNVREERGRYLAPESWLIPIIQHTASRLKSLGFKADDEFITLFASVPAAHVTGFEPLYEYVVDAYYELKEASEEAPLLTEPRYRPWLDMLEEEVEALAVFEEHLSDSSTVFHAEPILAAAALGLGVDSRSLGCWPSSGLRRVPGRQGILIERKGAKKYLIAPQSLYVLAAAGLSAAGVEPPGSGIAVLPDPALIRRHVAELRLPLNEAAEKLVEIVRSAAHEAQRLGVSEACVSEEFLAIEYVIRGPGHIRVKYLC